MRPMVAAAFIFLSGCGGGCCEQQDSASPNHGFGFAYDAMSKDGRLKLRSPGATTGDADFYAARSVAIEVCSGITAPAPPPFVAVVPRDSIGEKRVGLYFAGPPLILVDEGWPMAYEHEVLHYLLDATTGDLDPTHQHEAFHRCVFTFNDFIRP